MESEETRMPIYQQGYRPQTCQKPNRRIPKRSTIIITILCLSAAIVSVACIVARVRATSAAEKALYEKIASVTPFNEQVSNREPSQFSFSPYSYALRFNAALSGSGYDIGILDPSISGGKDSVFGLYEISDSVKLYILTDDDKVSAIMVRANDDSEMDTFRMASILAIEASGAAINISEAERLYSEIYTDDVPSGQSAKCERDIYCIYTCKYNGYREVTISK